MLTLPMLPSPTPPSRGSCTAPPLPLTPSCPRDARGRSNCDVELPPEPLEVSFTFAADAGSEMALLLRLDLPGELGGRREVVLRDWGNEVRPRAGHGRKVGWVGGWGVRSGVGRVKDAAG